MVCSGGPSGMLLESALVVEAFETELAVLLACAYVTGQYSVRV